MAEPMPSAAPTRPRTPDDRPRRMTCLVLLALAVLIAAPSVQAWAVIERCRSQLPAAGPDICRYYVDVDVDLEHKTASASVGACGERDPVWKVDADAHGGGASVWVPAGPQKSDGSYKETAGPDCESQGPPVRPGVTG